MGGNADHMYTINNALNDKLDLHNESKTCFKYVQRNGTS